MLKTLVASKTARLLATCVCPVVGAGVVTVSVPKVRHAVHRATAPIEKPRQYALPRVRERTEPTAVSSTPCLPIGDLPYTNNYLETPSDDPSPRVGPTTLFRSPTQNGLDPLDPPTPDTPVPTAVPEPTTWLQMVAGFTMLGGALRLARRPALPEEEDLLDRVDQERAKRRS